MHPLARLRVAVGEEEVDFVFAAGGDDHPLAQAELHLPRGQIRRANHQPPHQVLGPIDALDAGKDVSADCRRRG